jgi:hypothetical protein
MIPDTARVAVAAAYAPMAAQFSVGDVLSRPRPDPANRWRWDNELIEAWW